MNLSLAFFHGVQVLGALALAALIFVIGVPLVFYVWVWHTKTATMVLGAGVNAMLLFLGAKRVGRWKAN